MSDTVQGKLPLYRFDWAHSNSPEHAAGQRCWCQPLVEISTHPQWAGRPIVHHRDVNPDDLLDTVPEPVTIRI